MKYIVPLEIDSVYEAVSPFDFLNRDCLSSFHPYLTHDAVLFNGTYNCAVYFAFTALTSIELLPVSLHADVRVIWVPLPKPPDVLILQYKIILEIFRTNQSERRLPLETVRHAWNSAAFVSNFSNAWLQNHRLSLCTSYICKTTTATTLKSKHIKKYLHRILSQ